jgi:hypothetical protein
VTPFSPRTAKEQGRSQGVVRVAPLYALEPASVADTEKLLNNVY